MQSLAVILEATAEESEALRQLGPMPPWQASMFLRSKPPSVISYAAWVCVIEVSFMTYVKAQHLLQVRGYPRREEDVRCLNSRDHLTTLAALSLLLWLY